MQPQQACRFLFFDLDGTIIGKITNFLCELELIQRLRQSTTAGTTVSGSNCSTMARFKSSMPDLLKLDIIRPGFKELCSHINQVNAANGPVVYAVFVYTASDHEWSHMIIPAVERATNFTFARPFFTRRHCVVTDNHEYKKSLDRVQRQAVQYARKRFPNALVDFDRNCLMIDNTPDILITTGINAGKQVLCKTYNGHFRNDVLKHIPTSTITSNFKQITEILVAYGMLSKDASAEIQDLRSFYAIYYDSMVAQLKTSSTKSPLVVTRSRGNSISFWEYVRTVLAQDEGKATRHNSISKIISLLNRGSQLRR